MMNRSLKISIIIVGLYASLLSFLHGLFEILQGYNNTNNILIYAISKSNQTTEIWHGNFPAMTIIPNYLFSGISVCLISVFIIFYLFRKRYRFIVLFPISIILLLFGGGFIPPFLLVITSFSCLLINKKSKKIKNTVFQKCAKMIWHISITILILWSISEWILGYYFNSILVSISTTLFLFGIILPIFIILMGFLNDKMSLTKF